MSPLLTKSELADLLRMTKRQIDSLCETRTRAKQRHPLPILKINGNVRFVRTEVDLWLQKLREESR